MTAPPPIFRRMRHLLLIIPLLVAACNDVPWSGAAEGPPPNADAETFPPGADLRDGLTLIAAILDSAIVTQLNDDGVVHLLRAETLTDRILETGMPFGWLPASEYSLEARVWQIQARADRIVARLRAGARRDELLVDVQALREDVAALHTAISGGGTPAPVPIDRLLERLDSVTRRRDPSGT